MNRREDKVFELLRKATFSFEEARSILSKLVDIGYFDAPASSKHHLAYPGGLADHSINVCEELVKLTENNSLVWEHIRSPYVVGLLHDLCKVDAYVKNEDTDPVTYEYNKNCLLTGHGDKSVILAQQLILNLTSEELLGIRYHMGAYYKADWGGFDAAIREYPTVLAAHTADMIASKLIEG